MMRWYCVLLLLILGFPMLVHAQMHDNVWTFGYTCIPGDSSRFGGTNLYFGSDEVYSEYSCREARFKNNCNSSISDAEGNLLLMFNGCTLYDANDMVVAGSEELVKIDSNIEATWWCIDGYNTPHGAMFLPDPYDESKYYLFYRDIKELDEAPYAISDSLFVAEIHVTNDKPEVTSKYVVISDTVAIVGSSAVRHANGKDWWIISKGLNENIYHKILLDEMGVRLHSSQQIGDIKEIINGGNTTRFSPDGKYFVVLYPFGSLEIFEFDRGSGEFTEYYEKSYWADAQASLVIDTEFSPSGEFLYIAEVDTLWQFDMTVGPEDFFGTKTTVGVRDSFVDPFPTNFWLMQAAPDGRIYMSSRNSSQYLHVIHSPDEKGLGCNFENNGIKLPTVNARGMPYFPNYRLRADPTWVGTEEVREESILIYPNPASSFINLSTEENITRVLIIDTNGRIVLSTNLTEIDVRGLHNGLYYVEAYNDGEFVGRQKVVILK